MTLLPPALLDAARASARPRRLGIVIELLGLHLLVKGVEAAVGDVVEVLGPRPIFAEVAASGPNGLVCLPMGPTTGLRAGMHVRSTGGPLSIPVGPELLCGSLTFPRSSAGRAMALATTSPPTTDTAHGTSQPSSSSR